MIKDEYLEQEALGRDLNIRVKSSRHDAEGGCAPPCIVRVRCVPAQMICGVTSAQTGTRPAAGLSFGKTVECCYIS